MIVEKYYLQSAAIERVSFLMNKGFTIRSYKCTEEAGDSLWVIIFFKQEKATAHL